MAVSVAVVMMEGVTSTCVGREAVAGTSSCRSSAEVEMKNQFRRKGGATVVSPPRKGFPAPCHRPLRGAPAASTREGVA